MKSEKDLNILVTLSFPMLKVNYCAMNHPQVVPCHPVCRTFVLGVPTSPIFKRLMKKVISHSCQLQLKNRSTKSQTNQLHLLFFKFNVHQCSISSKKIKTSVLSNEVPTSVQGVPTRRAMATRCSGAQPVAIMASLMWRGDEGTKPRKPLSLQQMCDC